MKKKRSLTRQIMLMIFVLAAAAIMVCWVLNSTLLEDYYVMKKSLSHAAFAASISPL